MKIKLLAEFNAGTEAEPNVLPADSVIEVPDEAGARMIADGLAVEYTEEEVAAEVVAAEAEVKALAEAEAAQLRLEQKSLNVTVQTPEKKMNVFGKAIKDVIEAKATGMTGNAAVSGTDATEVLGVIAADSVLYGKCRKVPCSGNLNVVYSNTNVGTLPVIGIVAAGATGATTVPIAQYSAIPGKWFATVAVTKELLEDLPSLEAAVIAELRGELGIALDNSILNGTFGSSIGFKGALLDTNAQQADFASFAYPTVAELTGITSKVNPGVHPNCEWYINPSFWGVLENNLLTAANVANQLIKTGKQKDLLGFPVNLSFAVPANEPAVFGDFSKYVIGERRTIEVERDDSVLFDSDEVMIKIRVRMAGGLAAGLRTHEGSIYSSIAYAGLAAT